MILASAGSGKTWQLTNRYIAIMGQALIAGEEVRPERIVAVTFTRKAAGEFFDSILRKLARAARDPGEARLLAPDPDDPLYPILSQLGQEDYRQLLAIFLRRMPSLFLGTLDSFFAAILRSFPAEFGLSSQFDILDSHATQLARQDVYREVFRSRADQHRSEFLEAFKRATFGQEQAYVVNLLDDFVGKHHEIFLHAADERLWGNPQAIWPNGSPWLHARGDIGEDFERLFEIFGSESLTTKQWDYWEVFREEALLHSPGSSLPKRMAYFLPKLLEAWNDLQAGEARVTVARKPQEFSDEGCDVILRLVTRLVSAEIEVHLRRTQGIWHVLNQYETNYASLVRRRGRLTFSDLEIILAGCDLHSQSTPILSQKPDAFDRLRIDYRLDSRFDHWLLDEFQDTSYLQWSVIEPLIDEAVQDVSEQRSLFQVGDVKQAIYAWRGGDTRLFHDIYERYKGDGEDPRALRARPLNVSWRSGWDVIHLVNLVFGEPSALRDLAIPPDAISRWQWRPHEVAPPNEKLPGFAAYYHPVGTDGGDAGEEECFALALELLEEIRPTERGLSCAILVQENKVARRIVDYLRTHTRSGIPVASESDVSAAHDNPVTLAFLALFRAAAHPGDRFAQEHLAMSPLAAVLPDDHEALSREVLESVHRHGVEDTLRAWVSRLESAGIELDAFGRRRLEDLALAARLFDQSNSRSIDDFLRFAREYTIRESATGSTVQVMTIHKSKGLTFDVVLLPDLDGDSLTNPRNGIGVKRNRQTRAVEWVFDTPRRAIAQADKVLRSYRADQEAEAGYEELCKFYVALTRARHANYLIAPARKSGSRKQNFIRLLDKTVVLGNAPEVAVGQARAVALYESARDTADRRWYEHASDSTAEDETDQTDGPPTKEQEDFTPRARPRRRTPSGLATDPVQAAGLFSRRGKRARDHGTLVHALFEEIEWLDDFDPDRDAACWEAARLRAPHLFEAAHEEVLHTLTDSTVRELLARPAGGVDERAECWRERTFELLRDGAWISGTIDRVTVLRDGTGQVRRAFLVDFKTDQVADEEEARKKARHYEPQLQTYREALSHLLAVPPDEIETYALFTKLPLVVRTNADSGRA